MPHLLVSLLISNLNLFVLDLSIIDSRMTIFAQNVFVLRICILNLMTLSGGYLQPGAFLILRLFYFACREVHAWMSYDLLLRWAAQAPNTTLLSQSLALLGIPLLPQTFTRIPLIFHSVDLTWLVVDHLDRRLLWASFDKMSSDAWFGTGLGRGLHIE